MANFRQQTWRPNLWPRDGNKKPDSEPDIWRPYFWLTNSNEYGLFEAKYLASIFLARRQQ